MAASNAFGSGISTASSTWQVVDDPIRLSRFLSGLFLDGRAIVSSASELTRSETKQAIAVLQPSHHVAVADGERIGPAN